MLFNKKRPSKEMEETVYNNAHQISTLYEIIENLTKKLDEANGTIEVLKENLSKYEKTDINNILEERDTYKQKQEQWDETIKSLGCNNFEEIEEAIVYKNNNVNIEDNPLYKELKNNFNQINKEVKEMKEKHEKHIDDIKSEYENIIKKIKSKKEVPLPTPNNSSDKSEISNSVQNKIILKCPIYIYNNNDNEWKKFISNETKYKTVFNKDFKDIIDKNNVDINEVIDYIFKNREIKDTPSNRRDYKQKIERCWYLYDKYKDYLNLMNFSISKMSRIYKTEWNDWLKYLDEKIIEIDEMRKNVQNDKYEIIKKEESDLYNISNDIKTDIKKDDKNIISVEEETIFIDKKKNKKIKKDIKVLSTFLDSHNIPFNKDLCISCLTNKRTISSFCSSCATPA